MLGGVGADALPLGSWEGSCKEWRLTFRAEAAGGAEAGTAVLWVGAGLEAGLATLLVHLVGGAWAQGCRCMGPW